jgi:hypothetical protein
MKNKLFCLFSSIIVLYVRTITSKQSVYIESKIAVPNGKKSNQKDELPSIRIDSTIKASNNVKETFFSKINEHNKEAFDLCNQLWHSKAGWQHVTTKDGIYL